MDWQPIVDQSIAIAAPVVGSCLLGLLGIGLNRLNGYIKAKVQGEHLQTAILQVTEAAGSTVMDLEATVRKYMGDGKLTKAEQEQLRESAILRIRTLAPQAIEGLAKAGMKDLDAYLGGKIEQAVANMPKKLEAVAGTVN